MRRWIIAFASLLTAPAFAQTAVPEIPFDSQPNPLTMPKDTYLGEAAGVATDSTGNVYVFSRGNTTGPAYAAAAAQLFEFDPSGKFMREIGKNLYAWSFAHAVRIDRQDNIWVVDKGSDMIIKFDQDARVQMVFGRKQEASDEGTEALKHPKPPLPAEDFRFRQPTDVAWNAAGDMFISDGYINARVAKVDKNGDWVKSWDGPGAEQGQLNTPHSIAQDPPPARQPGGEPHRHPILGRALGLVHHAGPQPGALRVGRLSGAGL